MRSFSSVTLLGPIIFVRSVPLYSVAYIRTAQITIKFLMRKSIILLTRKEQNANRDFIKWLFPIIHFVNAVLWVKKFYLHLAFMLKYISSPIYEASK